MAGLLSLYTHEIMERGSDLHAVGAATKRLAVRLPLSYVAFPAHF